MAKRAVRRPKFLPIVLYALAGLVILALVIQGVFIKYLYARTDQLQTQELKAVLIDAAQSLNTELPVDPQTGRHYLPSVRLVLPATLETHIISRTAGEDGVIWLIDAGNQNRAVSQVLTASSLDDTFKKVGILQQCSRQVVLSMSATIPQDSPDHLTLKTTKHLKDGRTAYIYQNQCMYGAEPMLRSLDQMESY